MAFAAVAAVWMLKVEGSQRWYHSGKSVVEREGLVGILLFGFPFAVPE